MRTLNKSVATMMGVAAVKMTRASFLKGLAALAASPFLPIGSDTITEHTSNDPLTPDDLWNFKPDPGVLSARARLMLTEYGWEQDADGNWQTQRGLTRFRVSEDLLKEDWAEHEGLIRDPTKWQSQHVRYG